MKNFKKFVSSINEIAASEPISGLPIPNQTPPATTPPPVQTSPGVIIFPKNIFENDKKLRYWETEYDVHDLLKKVVYFYINSDLNLLEIKQQIE